MYGYVTRSTHTAALGVSMHLPGTSITSSTPGLTSVVLKNASGTKTLTVHQWKPAGGERVTMPASVVSSPYNLLYWTNGPRLAATDLSALTAPQVEELATGTPIISSPGFGYGEDLRDYAAPTISLMSGDTTLYTVDRSAGDDAYLEFTWKADTRVPTRMNVHFTSSNTPLTVSSPEVTGVLVKLGTYEILLQVDLLAPQQPGGLNTSGLLCA